MDVHNALKDPGVTEHCEQSSAILVEDEIQKSNGINMGFLLGPIPNQGSLDEICWGLKRKKVIKKHDTKFFLSIQS